jgi:SulP family sulfate permease
MVAQAGKVPVPTGSFNRLVSIATAGVVCGLLTIMLAIGNGSLVFAVHQTAYLPLIVGIALLSAAILAVVNMLGSTIRASVPTVQEVPCVVLGAMTGAAAASLPETASEAETLTTVLATLGFGTLGAGIGVLAIGVFRLGGLIRFIPYPVIGGFLAGTGWLILLGGLGLVLAAPANLSLFASIPEAHALARLSLAAVFVGALAFVRYRSSGPLAVPLVVAAAIVLFNLGVVATGASHDELRAAGWLVALPETGPVWHPAVRADFADIDWRALATAMLYLPALIAFTAIAVLLNATGIELEIGADIDLNRELRTVGAGNALAGLAGGLPGFPAISTTLIALRLGANSRWVGAIAGAIVVGALIFKEDVLEVIPTLVLGGMLLWLGGSLIAEWLINPLGRIDVGEYALIALIFIAVIVFGFLAGVAVGTAAAILLYVYRSSRVDVVHHQVSGRDYHSRVEGSTRREALLQEHGDAILVVRLQGFLFFGTANRLRLGLEEEILARKARGAGYLVIDFQRVSGLDSSVISSFARLQQVAEQTGFTIVLTGLSESARRAFLRSDLVIGDDASINIAPNLEDGLHWAEDALLAGIAPGTTTDAGRPLAEILAEVVGDAAVAETVAGYCERIAVVAGTRLIEANDPVEDIFFIESGDAVVEIAGDRPEPIHMAVVGSGAVVGELAFYLGEPRTGSVVARTDMVVWRFSRQAMRRLASRAPDAALRFHQGIAAMLSRRLMRTNRLVGFLSR